MTNQQAARQLPDIPSIMNGGTFIPSPLAVQALLMACSNAEEGAPKWSRDEGIPTYAYEKPAGITYIQVRCGDSDVEPDEMAELLWQEVAKLSDLDGDVFLAMLAQALAVLPDEKGFIWITGKQILEYRCIVPIRKRPNREWRAGDRQEDLAQVAACVGHLENIWISIRQWIEKGEEDKSSGGRKRKKSRRLYKHESRLIGIGDIICQSELDSSAQPSSPIRYPVLALAWRYQIGSWLEPFLKAPNRQIAWLLQQILHYDPYHEKWEKRLARYFTFHLRINAMKNSKTIKRTVGVLIDELSLPTDRRHPERTKQRFQQALERIRSDGQISSWRYQEEITELPPTKWFETWRAYHIEVVAEPTIITK